MMKDQKRAYVAPVCVEKGDIASLTQVIKTIGSMDGVFFTPDPGTVAPVPIGPYS